MISADFRTIGIYEYKSCDFDRLHIVRLKASSEQIFEIENIINKIRKLVCPK